MTFLMHQHKFHCHLSEIVSKFHNLIQNTFNCVRPKDTGAECQSGGDNVNIDRS